MYIPLVSNMMISSINKAILDSQRSIEYLSKEIEESNHSIELAGSRRDDNKAKYNELTGQSCSCEAKELREDISWDNRVVNEQEYDVVRHSKAISEYKARILDLTIQLTKWR